MDFGGPWTQQKLKILEHYLDAYTTALKNQSFKLLYIDAFAGTGQIGPPDRDSASFLQGSTMRAIKVSDRPFDELIFVDEDPARCTELEKLRETYPTRTITIENSDANDFLLNLQRDWYAWRGVLFLDPFATEVKWSTVNAIADYEALDTWILFPVSAIARMLPTSRRPDDISPSWVKRLTTVFGDESWRGLYRENPQGALFGDPGSIRDKGIDGLLDIYKANLRRKFGNRFLPTSRVLKNSKGSALFEFLFCVGHPNGIRPAKRIAGHILDNI